MGDVLKFEGKRVAPVGEPVVRMPMSPVAPEEAFRDFMADFDAGCDLAWTRTDAEDGTEVWRAGEAAVAIDRIVDVIKGMMCRVPFPPKK